MTGTDPPLREVILDAVAECFVRFGPRRTTVGDVAERAGVSRPTVYKHVGDREGMARALLEREWDRLGELVGVEMARYEGAVDKLVNAVVIAVTYTRRHPVFRRLLDCEPQLVLPAMTVGAVPVLQRAVDLLGPVVDQGHQTGELTGEVDRTVLAEWTARLALSLMTTPSLTVDVDNPDSIRRFVDHLFTMRPATAAGAGPRRHGSRATR